MAVKVISDTPVREIEFVCPKCFYKLAYTPADVKHCSDGDGDTTYWLDCPRPECKHRNYMKNEFTPPRS